MKNSSSTTIASYTYDLLGRRIQETHGGTNDLYYSAAWQVIQEQQGHVSSSTILDQYVWSRAYIDGLVLRDSGSGLATRLYAQQDANWNTTAILNASGAVQERFVYDPYGNVITLTSGGSATTDSFGWNYLHQGGRLDAATGLENFRVREYNSSLWRWMQQEAFGAAYVDGLNLYEENQRENQRGRESLILVLLRL